MSFKTHMTYKPQKRTWVTKEEHLRRKRQLALATTFVEAVEDAPDWTFRPLPIKELIVRYQPLLLKWVYQGHQVGVYWRHLKSVIVNEGVLYQIKYETNRKNTIHNFLCRLFICEIAGLVTEFLYIEN